MSFQEAVRTCLQRKYADFSGRARRSEFWFFVVFTAIAGSVAGILDAILHTPHLGANGLVGVIVSLALLAPGMAAGVRRMHDTGRRGWIAVAVYVVGTLSGFVAGGGVAVSGLLGLVTVVLGITFLVFAVQDSKPDNEYGPNPKGLGAGGYQQMPPPAAPPQY
ncbi:MAG TPA: DUF805 domain-containing protein [Kineosporiaceae bacterium]|jgi:uncharacterized membrane protein YhaH (DUF805 family)|nr:DUF805 domain-containing protein [Kineosporiaceae bacterium]